MPSLNKITIIGNVGNEPEMRFTPNGKPVTSFSVATNWVYTSPEGERRQETEWFNVVAWNRLAEQCNQFLEGQDGQTHVNIEVIANRVIFLDRRGPGALTDEKGEEGASTELEPEDLPF
jgi:single-strand DNA-binding protein